MKLFVCIFLVSLVAQSRASGSYTFDSSKFSNLSDETELNNLSGSHLLWQSSAASRPEAEWYKTKITQRLNNSEILSGMPQLKEKLFRLADENLKKCENRNSQPLDRGCMGRTSAHVMQLIGAVEFRYG